MRQKALIILTSCASVVIGGGIVATGLLIENKYKQNQVDLYEKGMVNLRNGNYKEASRLFNDTILKHYKDSSKKYSYSLNLEHYQSKTYQYEALINEGLSLEGNKVIVDFRVDGGTPVNRKVFEQKQEGKYITETTSKDHFDFLGWDVGYAHYDETNDAVRYVLDSCYSDHRYKIDINYGDGEKVEYAPSYYIYNHGAVEIPGAKRKGYSFAGYSSRLFDTPQVDFTIPNGTYGDLYLEATYTPNTYHVTFDASPVVISDEIDATYDSDITSLLPTPEIEHYTFIDWFYEGEPVHKEKFDIDHDVTLVAHYTTNPYQINYDLDGGHRENLPSVYDVETKVNIPYPEKDNAVFIGWTDDQGVDEPVINYIINVGESGNRTLTAHYVSATFSTTNEETTLVDISNHSIKEFVIPTNVKHIEQDLLDGLNDLMHFYVDPANEIYGVINNVLVSETTSAISYPKGLLLTNSVVELPSNVQTVESKSFYGTAVTEISGSSVKNINEYAFYNCNDLAKVNFTNLKSIGNYAFANTKVTEEILENNHELTVISEYAFLNTKVTSLNLSNKFMSLGNYAFKDCLELTQVRFEVNPNCVVGSKIFAGCPVTTLTADPKNLDVIYTNECFEENSLQTINLVGTGTVTKNRCLNQTNITKLDFSVSTLQKIDESAFEGTSITSLDLSNQTDLIIEENAFKDCLKLTEVTLLDGQIEQSLNRVFGGCNNLATIHIQIKETSDKIVFPAAYFGDLPQVKKFTFEYLGEENKEIEFGLASFKNDMHLEDIDFVNCSITSLSARCFEYCSSLTNADETFSDLTSYGDSTFYCCTNLTLMSFTGTKSLGRQVFTGCFNLNNGSLLTIPHTMEAIGEGCFYDVTTPIHLDFTITELDELTEDADCPFYLFDDGYGGVKTHN